MLTPLTRLERELLAALKAALTGTVPNKVNAQSVIAKAEQVDTEWDADMARRKEEHDANHYAHLDGMHQTPQPGCPKCQWEARHADDVADTLHGRTL